MQIKPSINTYQNKNNGGSSNIDIFDLLFINPQWSWWFFFFFLFSSFNFYLFGWLGIFKRGLNEDGLMKLEVLVTLSVFRLIFSWSAVAIKTVLHLFILSCLDFSIILFITLQQLFLWNLYPFFRCLFFIFVVRWHFFLHYEVKILISLDSNIDKKIFPVAFKQSLKLLLQIL